MTQSCAARTPAPARCDISGAQRALWIHTGASPSKGFGHLRRSLVLARRLAEDPDLQVVFVLAAHDRWSAAQVESGGFLAVRIDNDLAWPAGEVPAGIVVDIRGEESSRLLAIEARRRGIPILSIHDLGLELLPSDVIVDGSVAPGTFGVANEGSLHCGLSYLVLDREFTALNGRPKQLRKRIRRVTVALGGGDARTSLLRILEGLRLWGRDIDVTGIRGFSEWGQDEIVSLDWSPVRFCWAEREAPISELLYDADAVFAAGGMTLYESMCAGAPVMAVACDYFQHVTVASLARLGACLDLGMGMHLESAALPSMLAELEGDPVARARLSRRGRELVDGAGAERVAQLVRDMITVQQIQERQ